MLHLALTTFLAMPAASAPPVVVPATEAGAPRQASPAPRATPQGRRGGPSPTPTPAEPTPTPVPKASNDALVVVNKSDNSVSVFDAATGKLKWTAPVETGPHEAEILTDGRVVAISDYGRAGAPGHLVSLIDLATGKVISKIDTGEGSRPHGLKALKDGRLLATAEGRKELLVLEPRASRVSQRIETGRELSHMVAASPDGKRAFVTSLSGGVVTVIDLNTGKFLMDIPTGKGAEGLDVSPYGNEIWVANREANTISVVEAKELKVVATLPAAGVPIRLKFTPDGSRVLVSFAGTGEVGVYDASTRAEVKRIPLGRDAVHGTDQRVFQKRFGSSPAPVGLLIAPDGKRAWVSASHADVVVLLDLVNLRVEDAWSTGKEPDGLAGRFEKKKS